MLYYSLNKQASNVTFKQATINGQAPDKGLYFPVELPKYSKEFIDSLANLSNANIAYNVIQPYVGADIDEESLRQIVTETIDFDIPLVPITNSISSLELYHGPTLAFKDIGARFMSRCLGYFSKNSTQKITVLVATSGDTGGAVANGFYDVDGVEVVILYPKGKVSTVQEKQLTTLGKNIKALEVDGNFDDCQNLVKQAFVDEDLKQKLFLTSANSINVARWLPQQFYYFFAYKQWMQNNTAPPVFCVPSGNFGNICAGILAHINGLPVKHFIAATNANKTVPSFMQSQQYNPLPTVPTISNAMDVSNPSNFIRILQIFENNFNYLSSHLSSVSVTDNETKTTLKNVYEQQKYLLDPHGAVAYHALENYLQTHINDKGIILETAHPVKFYDVVEPIINEVVAIPEVVKSIIYLQKNATEIKADFNELKQFLMN